MSDDNEIMSPGTKRTILISKTTGRRYFLGRASGRPGGRRYYVCSDPNCSTRVIRETDLYCKAHSTGNPQENQDLVNITTKSEQMDESDIPTGDDFADAESPSEQQHTKPEAIFTEQLNESTNNGTRTLDSDENSTNESTSEHVNGNTQADLSADYSSDALQNRQIQIDELTGSRSFRDHSGRRRYLCMQTPCANVLRRQTDLFCRQHMSLIEREDNLMPNKRRTQQRYSAPTSSSQPKTNRFRSPFETPTTTNGVDGAQSDELEAPKRHIVKRSNHACRSFRDASGKIRFLCSVTTCHSRVPRQSEPYCRRHLLEMQAKELELKNQQLSIGNGGFMDGKESVETTITTENGINRSAQPITSEIELQPESKRRKRDSAIAVSTMPSAKIVIATTALLDDQWNDVFIFLRRFPHVQLSTNLNVNNATTHLLVDDSENNLHCTITKKIVQAAVRRHIFIISSRWVNECMRLNKFIDEHPYEILSDSHTTLRLSRQDLTPTNRYLFSQNSQYSYAFAIECRQCQGSINRSELVELIQLTGAQLFQSDQAVDVLIVLCDTSDKNLNKIKEKYANAPASNIKYVTSDFLLKSIIKFEIQDIDKYSL